jgi:hypothetical protein
MERLPSGFTVRDGFSGLMSPESFSLSGGQAWIGAFLVVDHFPCAFTLDPAGFSLAFAGRAC